MQKAILALGCCWEPEEKFHKIKGIISTEVGYCGGNNPNVTYEEVCSGSTNHAEVVKIEFNENTITYEDIIKLFFDSHDATQLNGQGLNIGTNYRSEIFYTSEDQKKVAEKFSTNRMKNSKEVWSQKYLKKRIIVKPKNITKNIFKKEIVNDISFYSLA